MSDLMNSIFNVNVNVEQPEESVSRTEFRPSAKKSKTGVYKAVIRFLPNPVDPSNKSIIKKNVAFLKNMVSNEGRYVDCPSTVGQPDPIADTFFKLRNSDSAVKKEQSKIFSRKQKYASLVQVLACETQPELENKILVWSYGFKIYQKIVNEMQPPIGTPRNPFDLINGRVMSISVNEVSGFNNYDNCQFLDVDAQTRAFRIGITQQDGSVKYAPITEQFISNEKGRQMVLDFLTKESPDTTPYEYKPWDEETATYVATIINMYTNPGQYQMVQNANAPVAQTVDAASILNGTMQSAAPQQSSSMQTPAQHRGSEDSPVAGLQLGLDSVNSGGTGFNGANLGIEGLDDIMNNINNDVPKNNGSQALSLDDVLNGIV